MRSDPRLNSPSRKDFSHVTPHYPGLRIIRLMRCTALRLLCRFHHRAVHEEGFRVVAAEVEGQFRFLRPDGEPVPDQPPPACWVGAPLAPTDARLAAAGISIGAHTATPNWYGEPLRLQSVLDVLWEPTAAKTG